jgi:hypothetical protein
MFVFFCREIPSVVHCWLCDIGSRLAFLNAVLNKIINGTMSNYGSQFDSSLVCSRFCDINVVYGSKQTPLMEHHEIS